MAASRFEEMLASGKTRVLEPVGRDLSSLGQPDTPERPASTPRRRSSPFSRPRRKRNASAQSDETTLGDEAIVSAPTLYATTAYDSPTPAGGRTATTTAPAGHSSSPDLAALVAKQKRRSTVPDEALPSRRGSLPPSESMHSTMAAAGSIRALSPSLSDPGGLSDSGSLSPPSLAVGRARQLSATPSLGQVSARSDEQSPPQPPHSRAGSFVVVSPEQPTDPRASKRKSSGPTGGLRIDMGTGAVGSQGIGSSRVSLEQPSAVPSSLWGNSVRKTSGLLKRTFGSKQSRASATSAPSTPLFVHSNWQNSPPPPVPALPNYAKPMPPPPAEATVRSTSRTRPAVTSSRDGSSGSLRPYSTATHAASTSDIVSPPMLDAPSMHGRKRSMSASSAHEVMHDENADRPPATPEKPPSASWAADWHDAVARIGASSPHRRPDVRASRSAPSTPVLRPPEVDATLARSAPRNLGSGRETLSPALSARSASKRPTSFMPGPTSQPIQLRPRASSDALKGGLPPVTPDKSPPSIRVGEGSAAKPVATPEPSVPLLTTQSPSPAALRTLQQTPTRGPVRQSIVGYPASTRSPPMSRNGSGAAPMAMMRSSSQPGHGSSGSLARPVTGSRAPSDDDLNLTRAATPNGSAVPVERRAEDAARRLLDEDESFLRHDKVAEWLGGTGRVNQLALKLYLQHFDFAGLRLDIAFRRLCDKLYLKAESQQIDRILDAFAQRYWRTCPSAHSVYGSPDVVHIVTYTLLLLNTDLHVVDSTSRMSRAQFVRNTMAAVVSQQTPMPGKDDATDVAKTGVFTGGAAERSSLEKWRDGITGSGTVRAKRSGSIVSFTPATSSVTSLTSASPVRASSRTNEAELESLLKDMYAAIRAQPVFQPGSAPGGGSSSLHLPSDPNAGRRSSLSLTPGSSPYGTWAPGSSSGVNRAGSRKSQGSVNNGSADWSTGKRGSVRGLLGSADGHHGPIGRSASPAPSSVTSFSEHATGSTAYGGSSSAATSTIMTSHGTLGFAGNLSHTIIKEQHEHDDALTDSDAASLSGASVSDDELALLGAPWAKEGLLRRKHYWDAPGKRSKGKDKDWLEVFVVIERGTVRMFRFGDQSGANGRGGGVGGGNWLANAQAVGELSLIHALCAALPAPGYNKNRPHVFALTLATGSSFFFQAGTADLINEWVSTCNYWSARLSREPLTGGVSNMEYGWRRVQPIEGGDEGEEVQGEDELAEELADDRPSTSTQHAGDTASVRSGRSGRSRTTSQHGSIGFGSSTIRIDGRPGDRFVIHDWQAPQPPAVPSTLSETAQLEALHKHVEHVRAEHERHLSLRALMIAQYSPRSNNARRAQDNWEKRTNYLTSEVFKFSTYHDALSGALKLRQARTDAKAYAAALERAAEIDMTASPLQDALELKSLPIPPPSSAATDKLAFGEGDEREGSLDEEVEDYASARGERSASTTATSLIRV